MEIREIKPKPHYDPYSASAIVAGFDVRLVDNFWKKLSLRQAEVIKPMYYEVNRSLGDTIKDLTKVFACSYKISRELYRAHEENSKNMAIERLSRMLADELIKSDRIVVRKTIDPFSGDHEFSVELPIIILEDSK